MPNPISYTGKDYDALRAELIARIPHLTNRWTDFNPSDLGVVLLELFAGVADMLAYSIDAYAAEAFLDSARQRQNVINLCKLIAYRLDSPVASTTNLRFSLSAPLQQDLAIPQGTHCGAVVGRAEIPFETAVAAILHAGELSVDVPARQGIREAANFSGTGEAFQSFALPTENVAQGSIRLWVDGISWLEVDHFQESGEFDDHFCWETDALDAAMLRFGDGIRGKRPPAESDITVTWLRTLGDQGNLAPDLINRLRDSIQVNGQTVRLSVTNSVPATGGRGRETLDHARAQAPAELKTLWKAVTKQDYESLALGFPGVAKVRVVDSEDCDRHPYYRVGLAVAPNGGGPPSSLLLAELNDFLQSRKVITVEIDLYEPRYRPIRFAGELFAFVGQEPSAVLSRARQALSDMLHFDRVDFGASVFVSDVVAVLDGVRGVSHVHLYAPAQDVRLGPGEIPILGEIELTVRSA